MNFECYSWNTHSRCTMFTWATCNDDRLSTVLFFFVNTVICFSKSITVTDLIHMLLLSTWIFIKSINSEYWIHLHHCSMVTFSRVKVFERNHRFSIALHPPINTFYIRSFIDWLFVLCYYKRPCCRFVKRLFSYYHYEIYYMYKVFALSLNSNHNNA